MDASTEDLIALLEDRDYGDLSKEDVIERVRAGEMNLVPSAPGRQPMIRWANGAIAKGTGRSASNLQPQEWSKKYIRRKFAQNAPALWEAAFKAATQDRDPRAMKLLFEYGVGDHREAGQEPAALALQALLEMARGKRVEHIYVTEGEARDIET